MSGKGNFPSTQKQVSLFQRLHSDLFSFCSIFIVFCLTCFSFLSLSCSASPPFSPACSLWGNPWQIKLRRTYQRQITSCALRKALLHQSARVLRRASSLQCLTCELDMHPTEEEVEKWYPHYSKWIKNISLTNTPDYILPYGTHTYTRVCRLSRQPYTQLCLKTQQHSFFLLKGRIIKWPLPSKLLKKVPKINQREAQIHLICMLPYLKILLNLSTWDVK